MPSHGPSAYCGSLQDKKVLYVLYTLRSFQSLLQYGTMAWGGVSLAVLEPLSVAQRVADDLHLHLISDDEEFKYKSLVMTLKESGNCFLEISNLVEVQPRSKSVIIGVIDIPCFRMKNNFTVTGMVSYKVADELSSDDHQINLPCMSLGSCDLIKGALIPFLNNQLSVQDIASVMAVFEKTELEIILPEKHCNLDNTMDQLGYSKLVLPNCSPCFVNNSNRNNALSQSVLFLNTTSKDVHNFVCYTRNEHQLLLLAHSLLSLLPHKSQVLKKLRLPTSLDNSIDHLGSEISYLTDTLRSHILPCDGPLPDQCQLKFKADLWQEIRQKMCAYELETDFALQGLAT